MMPAEAWELARKASMTDAELWQSKLDDTFRTPEREAAVREAEQAISPEGMAFFRSALRDLDDQALTSVWRAANREIEHRLLTRPEASL